ncbi:hypothetical protein CSW64_00995 [Caulobacter mirabilis]|uniref:S-type pyocin family protein n=2 Tax=Caulobacter mirabilis TaxID=69666 RepID=A0A2D2ASX8_9CAUL|nr:hypothetical protein CSW64_00995 [Caulobacter mirabilis]
MDGLRMAWPIVAGAALLLAGCDGGASAVPMRGEAAPTPVAASAVVETPGAAFDPPPRQRPEAVRRIDGKPVWSSNRRYSAEENARRHFERDGAAFNAGSVDDYVAKAHAFINRPPAGVETLTRRNGDRLLYDPAGNVFAVATRDGAPRTMFKPREGSDYWREVKAREAEGGARRNRERTGDRGGERG